MKRTLTILMLLLLFSDIYSQRIGFGIGISRRNRVQPNQTTYYVSSSAGSDNNNGLSPSTPFASLDKVNTLDLSGNVNKVYFKRGDSWEGTITIGQSGTTSKKIIFDAYGTGEDPVIYGSDEITGWSVHSGSIYKATYATTLNQLFVDNERLLAAREPDTGFFTVDAAPTTSQITSAQLNGALNYTGAQCIIHSSSYGLETKSVTGSSSTTITLTSAPFGNVNAGEKFILVGKLEFLDSPGEWYYDSNADLVYVWLPDSSNPSTHIIRGSITDYGLTASSKSNFIVKNLKFTQQKVNGINISSCNDYTIDNVEVSYVDHIGISDLYSENGVYSNNTIIGANRSAILSELSDSMLIQNNTVKNIALFENLGLNGVGPWYGGSGIATNGYENEIYSNTLDSIGYNGISFNGKNFVKYNYVNEFCLTKNDGGGIYTSCNVTAPEYVYGNEMNKGSVVQYNTILNGRGVTTNVTANTNGIYLDESSGGITVNNNNIGYCSGWGLFWHKGNSHVARNNVLFANKTGFINTPDGDNSEFKQNKIYALTGQLLMQQVNSVPTVTTLAIDSNIYVQHYGSYNFNIDWTGSKNWTYWRANTPFDDNTPYDTIPLAANYSEKFIYNETSAPKTFYLNNATNLIDAFSNSSITTSFVLAPYSSRVIEGLNPDCVVDYSDAVAPTITSFAIPDTVTELTFALTTLETSGEATGYFVSTTNSTPTLTTAGWVTTKPTQYTVVNSGDYTVYVWVRDEAGNISSSASATIYVNALNSLFNGLVADYEFEVSGTTLDDESPNNLDGINKNSSGVTTSITVSANAPGNGYPYISTGVRQTDVADNALFDCFTSDFTIAGWVNVTSLSGPRTLVAKTNEFALLVTTGGALQFRAIENGGSNYITVATPNSTIVTGTRYFVVVRANGNDRKSGYTIRINDASVTNTTGGDIADLTNGIVSTSNALNIGYYATLTASMYGNISQLNIWDRELNAAEETYLYNSGNGRALSDW